MFISMMPVGQYNWLTWTGYESYTTIMTAKDPSVTYIASPGYDTNYFFPAGGASISLMIH